MIRRVPYDGMSNSVVEPLKLVCCSTYSIQPLLHEAISPSVAPCERVINIFHFRQTLSIKSFTKALHAIKTTRITTSLPQWKHILGIFSYLTPDNSLF